MIFHIPTDTELISTDIVDNTPVFDETQDYVDGTEVQKDGSIYETKKIITPTKYPDFVDYKHYNVGDIAVINGVAYKKIAYRSSTGCFQTYSSDVSNVGTMIDLIEYAGWDGARGVDTTFTVGSESPNCNQGVEILIDYNAGIFGNDYYNVAYRVNSGDAWTLVDRFYLKDTLSPQASSRVIYNDTTSKLERHIGYAATDVSTTGVDNSIWEVVDSVYYDVITYELLYLRPTLLNVPFDTKQYTSVKAVGSQTWKIKPRGYHSNAVVIGGVKGRMLTVMFMNSASEIIAMQQIDLTVNKLTSTQPRDNGNPVEIGDGSVEASTQIVYLQLETTPYYVEIKVDDQAGLGSEIGWIMATSFIDVGATNLEFTHNIKNFDKNKVSEVSGYIDHIKGQRVVQHSGSFDIPLTDYDKMLMINKRFTQELIAIDGSDTTNNEASDSKNRFQSTKLIGRTKRLSMSTKKHNETLGDYQTITFEFEEVV